ncbi:glycerate kinase [Corallococcus sp. AB004]|uniref:glycerate kinase n=1 Tax=Corallococcus exiguus TaxID=83462 RepID=UPI000EA38A14|nr:glycerate kinase [Corallococcus exiguus]NPD29647.1 glycerate kinase [Corallococcus exiguus]RKI36690.1 glycerate kinase [Corallococcus sp. AB004]
MIPPRWLLAPQEFKGTLSAAEAADAMAEGLRQASLDVVLDVAPLADGGPGTLDALLAGTPRAERRKLIVRGPMGTPVDACWAWLDDGRTAVVEMAQASGLALVPPSQRDARAACTHGTGELVRAALDSGCERLIVGLGGSATTDGGKGALEALGFRFLDADGAPLPPGGASLARLSRVDASGKHPRLDQVELLIATDVTTPLLGADGSARLFGPQKGADAAAVEELETALATFCRIVDEDAANLPGAGAAGGLGYGLAALGGGKLTSGYDLVARALGMERRVLLADLVLTGEGRFDRQTSMGKGPVALARLARAQGTHVVLFAGVVQRDNGPELSLFRDVVELNGQARPGATARETLRDATAKWALAHLGR